jgi:ribosomal protein L7/L12
MGRNNSFSTLLSECENLKAQGLSQSDLITRLRGSGATIVDTIKVLKELYGLSLGTAKETVSTHPVWRDLVEAHALLQDEIERILSEQG